MKTKVGGTLIGALVGILNEAPATVKILGAALVCLMMVDLLTGVGAAAVRGQIRSRTLRVMAYAKAVQYFGLWAIAVVTSVVASAMAGSQVWWTYTAIVGLMCATEVASVWENIVRLEQYGANLGPFKPLVERTRDYFAVKHDNDAPAAPAQEEPK